MILPDVTSPPRRPVPITDEQFTLLWDAYPHDETLIGLACQEALSGIHPPNPTGRTQLGVRVYQDNGWNGSGYTMVHWDDAKKLVWCLDNGYPRGGFPERELPIIWDDDPERERLESIRNTLWAWIG